MPAAAAVYGWPGCTRLASVRRRRNRLRQRADRVREVHGVEQVEHLGAELDVAAAAEREVLREEEVHLLEVRPVDRVALEVAERAGLRRRERGRIQEQQAAVLDERDRRRESGRDGARCARRRRPAC